MSDPLYEGLLAAVGITVFIAAILAAVLAFISEKRQKKRRQRVEDVLELALEKIIGGKISGYDREWAWRTQQRLWMKKRGE